MKRPHLPSTLAGYLALESAEPEQRYEFWDGEIFGMGGASQAHNAVTLGFASQLRRLLRNSGCAAMTADMRTRVGERRFAYPDVVVACPPEFDRSTQPETLLNPKLVVEVLSPTTEAFDRGRKFAGYQARESLTDYVLASQDSPRVEHYARAADGSWVLRTYGPGARIRFESLNVELDLNEVYRDVPPSSVP